MINVGELIGALAASFIGDYLGRKGGLYVSSTLVCIGVVLQVAGSTFGTLIPGRIILGIAVGLISNFVPLLVADCAPAECRGALVTMYQLMIGIGLLLGSIVTNYTNTRPDTGAYRIPMAVQLLCPILLVFGLIMFIPESPRWLLQKGRKEDTLKSLRRLRHGQKDRDRLVELEMAELEAEIRITEGQKRASWRNVFKYGPEGRKAYLLFALQAFQQASGINFITGYGVVFFFSVGVQNPFFITIMINCVGYPALWLSQILVEKVGRRPLLIYSGILECLILITMGGLGTVTDKSSSVNSGIVAMVFIFVFVFNTGWGPSVWVLCSELSVGPNRGELMSIATASNWLFTWVVSFTFPYLLNSEPGSAGLGARVGFIYGSLTLAAVVWTWFLLPETRGKTLDDIEECFEKHIPARKFKDFQSDCSAVRENLRHQYMDSVKPETIEIEHRS